MNQRTLTKVAAGAAVAGLAVASGAGARPSGWPATTDGQVEQGGAMVQATRTMSLDLPGSADRAFPLFGPDREREWSPEWDPKFVVPTSPGQTADGAVFLVDHDPNPMVWVMTDYDPAERIVRYVVVRAGRTVTQLWIQVVPVSVNACRADVTYRYTALAPEGRLAVEHFVQSFPEWKRHWESHIAPVLAHGAPAAAHEHGRP
jgi:hypothetical protein